MGTHNMGMEKALARMAGCYGNGEHGTGRKTGMKLPALVGGGGWCRKAAADG